MSRDESDEREEEYADWTLPGQSGDEPDEGGAPETGGGDEVEASDTPEAEEKPTPPELRKPLLRDRIRERLGVTPRQWYVIETFLLVLPYPVFVLIYFAFDVNETLFLAVTLLYSLVATYVGFLS